MRRQRRRRNHYTVKQRVWAAAGVCLLLLLLVFLLNPGLFKITVKQVESSFYDHLKGKPYSRMAYDGIDVSKHNGVIQWQEVAKNTHIQFVYIKATEGRSLVDKRYRANIAAAREAGLRVGSYHFFTSRSSAQAQFRNFSSVADKQQQDLIPLVDVEEKGVRSWTPAQVVDSLSVFVSLVKQHYGKLHVIYSGSHFYNEVLAPHFNHHLLFIAAYKDDLPKLKGPGRYNIWQYSERGHVKGIGNYVDLNRFVSATTIDDLLL